MIRVGVHGGAGLAPAVGLIRSLSAVLAWLVTDLPCGSLLQTGVPDPTNGGSVGMFADTLDYVIGVDTDRDRHVLAVVAAPTGALIAQRSIETDAGG
jgi:hypothetical protein